MSLAVLQSEADTEAARQEMIARGASLAVPVWAEKLLRAVGLQSLIFGDRLKSWDVWKTARFLEDHLPRDAPIVDFGAYRSEILAVLHLLGFKKLHGVDLNPDLARQRFHDQIAYCIADYCKTPYESGSFAAVTSISALEHGLDLPRFLDEVSRVLRPGGFFLASTDYWPDKVDTTGHRIFDMTWTIFDRGEIERLLALARDRGLEPVGPIDFTAASPVIHHANRDYTFAWIALRKGGNP